MGAELEKGSTVLHPKSPYFSPGQSTPSVGAACIHSNNIRLSACICDLWALVAQEAVHHDLQQLLLSHWLQQPILLKNKLQLMEDCGDSEQIQKYAR